MNQNNLSLEKFILVIKSRYLLIVGAIVLTVISANIFDEIKTVKYKATATVIVDYQDPVSTTLPLPALLQEDYMETQLGIIRSKFMAEKVINYLKLDQQSKIQALYDEKSPEFEEFRSWISTFILNQLSVYVHNKNTRLIKISFSSESQQKAIDIANAFADLYIKTTLDLNLTPIKQTAKWFEEQLQPMRIKLENAENNLARYQEKKNILAGNSRHSDAEIERLALLTNDWAATQSEMKNIETLILQTNQLKDIDDIDKLPLISESQFLLNIKNELNDKENGLIQVSNLYGVNHPNYLGYISELNNLRNKYSVELNNYIEGLTLKLNGTRQKEEELQQALVNQRKKVFSQREQGSELPILERELESARSSYKETFEQFQDYTLRGRASQTNVTLLNPANLDIKYSNVEKKNISLLGAFLGLIIGLFMAVMFELLNGRILDPKDLENALDVPFIGVIGKS